MEDGNITYLYSKGSCILYSFFVLWAMFLTCLFALDAYKPNYTSGMIFWGLILLAELAFLIIITIRYSIPAIKRKVALEINQQGIIDYTRNTITEWTDITDLRMAENKGDATIYLYFKRPDNSEDYKRLRLRWVKGDYLEIYGIIEANLEERGSYRS